MKARARKTIIATVLVAGLTIGAVSFVVKLTRGSGGAASDPVANVQRPASSAAVGVPTKVASGRFTGPTVNAYYGYVQVQAVVKNGRVQNVVVLQHPNDNGTSRYINSVAMPYLVQEAVQAQSGNINLISGATFSSMAFARSLDSALSAAGL